MRTKSVSIVIPAYNEEKNIPLLYEALKKSLNDLKIVYEIIFVDDGSTDGSRTVLEKIATKDKKVKVVILRRRFGQTAAMSAGFDTAVNDVVVTLDGDLQNDPTDIAKLLDKMDEGFDVVSGWRKDRKEPFLSRRLPSMIANRLIAFITGVEIHDTGCTLKAYRKEVLEDTHLYGEMHRFIPATAQIMGARIAEVVVKHHPRKFGKAKYGINRTLRVILDALTVKFLLSYQTRPMHFFGKLGVFIGGLGGILFVWLIYQRVFLSLPLSSRPAFLVSIFFVLIGLQFIMTGLLAEMLTRIYFESQHKKIYTVRKKIN